jgi:hypothetical protein
LHTSLIELAEEFVDDEFDLVTSQFLQLTLVSREEDVLSSSGSHDLVLHMQHLRWYPHVRAWHHHFECVIKHTDYAKYVGEDPAALPRHRWNRGRRRIALHERERIT